MAQSRETVKLEVAPQDVRDRRALRAALIKRRGARRVGGARHRRVAEVGDAARPLSSRSNVASIMAMRGVHATSIVERAYAFSQGTRRIVGRVDEDGAAVDGVELALDSLLRGVPGAVTTMRDGRGRQLRVADGAARARRCRATPSSSRSTTSCRRSPSGRSATPWRRWAPRAATSSCSIRRTARCWRWRAGARIRAPPRRPRSPSRTSPVHAQAVHRRGAARRRSARASPTSSTRSAAQMTINGRTITDEHHAAALLARRRDPLLEQHRHRAVRRAPVAARGVRGAARLRLRHADRRSVSGRSVRHAARAEALVEAVGELAGDGLRDLCDAAAARGGVRRDRERRRAARARAREGGARARRPGALPAPAARGTARALRRRRAPQCADAARRGRGQRHGARRPTSRPSPLAGKTGTARRTVHGRYAAGAAHPDVRRAVSRRPPTVRDPREARQPAGRVLRRPHGGAGDEGGARGGARVAQRGARPRHARGEPAGCRARLARDTADRAADARLRGGDARRAAGAQTTRAHAERAARTRRARRRSSPCCRRRRRRAAGRSPPRAVPDVRGLSLRAGGARAARVRASTCSSQRGAAGTTAPAAGVARAGGHAGPPRARTR